jgi:hypothetical protein
LQTAEGVQRRNSKGKKPIEEERAMRTSVGRIRNVMCLMTVLMISTALAACGSGGGSAGSTSPGVSGPATVSVSVASAPDYPAGTTLAAATASPTGTSALAVTSPLFDHVWVRVNRIALIPVDSIPFMERNKPHQDGELEEEDTAEGNNGFVTVDLEPPKTIDLLDPPSGAKILNRFPSVPAGEYGKIRVYYDSVVGEPTIGDNVLFHPTANYHFDVHFVGGNLVVPVSSDPSGGIRFFQVTIGVVGLKIHQAGNSGNVLLRPQVFATVESSPEYIVTGVADNVTKINYDGTFDILTIGGRTIPAAFSDTGTGTTWAYSDNVLEDSQMVIGRGKAIAVPAFKNGAIVSSIGVFDTVGRLQASHITFTFPDVRIGKIFSTWSSDTSFRLNLPSDNLVYASPDKLNPLYTNFRVPPVELANGYNLIVPILDNTVKARGYFPFIGGLGTGLQSFWISIDNNIGP